MGKIVIPVNNKPTPAGGGGGEGRAQVDSVCLDIGDANNKSRARPLPRTRTPVAHAPTTSRWLCCNCYTFLLFLLLLFLHIGLTYKVIRNLCIENMELRVQLANENKIRGILSVAVVEFVPRESFERTNFTERDVASYSDPQPELQMSTFRSVITMWYTQPTICEMLSLANQLTRDLYQARQVGETDMDDGDDYSSEEEFTEDEEPVGVAVEDATTTPTTGGEHKSGLATTGTRDIEGRGSGSSSSSQPVSDTEFDQMLQAAADHLEAKIDRDREERRQEQLADQKE